MLIGFRSDMMCGSCDRAAYLPSLDFVLMRSVDIISLPSSCSGDVEVYRGKSLRSTILCGHMELDTEGGGCRSHCSECFSF